MKNLSNFKSYLAENKGKEVKVTNLLPPIRGSKNWKGAETIRKIGKVQTNGLYTDFIDEDGKEHSIWVEFPKAKYIKVSDNKVEFLAYETELSCGEKTVFPDSALKVNEPWLIFEF